MNSFTCPRYTVSHRPRTVAIAALVVVLAVCAFATPAQAASGSGGSNDAIIIEPRPLFDENELRGLIEKPALSASRPTRQPSPRANRPGSPGRWKTPTP